MAELIYKERKAIDVESIYEIRLWAVPKSAAFPEGVKYSMVIVENGREILCYDNAHGKGHHRHVMGREEQIEFRGVDGLIGMFRNNVEEYRVIKAGGMHECEEGNH